MPSGTTLAEQHLPRHRGGGAQLLEPEQGRAGFHHGASPCCFGAAIPSVLGVACSPQLIVHPALLLSEQLSSLACKGNKTAPLTVLGANRDPLKPCRRHADPPASQTLAENPVKIFDGVALFADDSLARGRCFAPIWLLGCCGEREGRGCGGDPSLSAQPNHSLQTALGRQGVLSGLCKSPRKFIALYKSLKRRKRLLLCKERKWWGKE